MNIRETALGVLISALTVTLTACNMTPEEPDPSWQTDEVVAASDRVLWKVTLLVLEKQGYPLAGGVDPSSLILSTGWRTNLAPFSGDGYRTKAVVEMAPLGDRRWEISVRIKKQVNRSLKPLDLRYAEWEWVADDVSAAGIILQHVRARLNPEIELRERPGGPLEAFSGPGDERSRP